MGSSYYEKLLRNRNKAVPAMSASMTAGMIREEKNNKKEIAPDSALRKELQENIIKPLAEQGLGILEIVAILESETKYQQFKPYFYSYAENQVNKARKAQKTQKEQGEER